MSVLQSETLNRHVWRKDSSYFGMLVKVGLVLGEDLGNSYFVLLRCQMEGSQAALQENTHNRSFSKKNKTERLSLKACLGSTLPWWER